MSQPPETQMNSSLEFLSRSWPGSSDIPINSRAVMPPLSSSSLVLNSKISGGGDIVLEHCSGGCGGGEVEGSYLVFNNPFWFETSQMVMDRILSHSQEVSPRTSGRLSHSSGSLNAADTPPFSPLDIALDHFKIYRPNYTLNSHLRATVSGSGASSGAGKTVGRWLKERKEKRKEENRTQNAQLHAAVSVAGVAAAIAAIASASANNDDGEQIAKTDIAMASAATLVAAQCVEAAEAMGAEHDHLASVISSAVNVKSAGDIMTLTAAAATALRGAATLKSRALKEVYNAAATAMPGDRGFGASSSGSSTGKSNDNINNNIIINQIQRYSGELLPDDSFLGNRGVLANGWELLKRTRNGDLHWKIVSVYINRMNQVMLKMKSRHVAGTITKKKKNMVVDVVKDIPAWPGRHLLEGGDDRRYFGLKTEFRGVVEFECRNQREYDLWTQGVSKLLSMVSERNNRYRG